MFNRAILRTTVTLYVKCRKLIHDFSQRNKCLLSGREIHWRMNFSVLETLADHLGAASFFPSRWRISVHVAGTLVLPLLSERLV